MLLPGAEIQPAFDVGVLHEEVFADPRAQRHPLTTHVESASINRAVDLAALVFVVVEGDIAPDIRALKSYAAFTLEVAAVKGQVGVDHAATSVECADDVRSG